MKTGSGTLTLATAGHSATGGVTVNEGTLRLTGFAGFDGGTFSNNQTFTINGGSLEIQGSWLTKSGSTYEIRNGTLAFTQTTGDTSANYVNALNLTNATVTGPATYRVGNNTAATHTFSGDEGNTILSGFGMVRNTASQTVNLWVDDGLHAADLTISGPVYDVTNYAGSTLNKDGPGTLVLTANCTYSGPTSISNGTLQLGDGGSSGKPGTGTITNHASLTFNRADDLTLPNPLTGSGSVAQLGTGKTTLSGTLSHTGNTTVHNGTLELNSPLASSPITVHGGWLAGTGALNQVTVLPGGSVRAGSNGAGNLAIANLTLAAGSSLVTTPGSAIIEAGNITVEGLTLIHLAGNDRTTGSFPVVRYTSLTGNGLALGHIAPRTAASLVNNTATSSIDLVISHVDQPRWTGAANAIWDDSTRNWIEIQSGNATTFLAGDDVVFDDTASGSTTIQLDTTVTPHSVTFNNSQKAYTLQGSGEIAGTGGMSLTGTGKVTLDTTHTFTGQVHIAGATLESPFIENAGTPGPLGAGNQITMNAGTLAITQQTQSNRSILLESGGGTLHTANTLELSGPLSGPGTLNITGTGNTVLTANNAFSGGTTIHSGTLTAGSNSALGTAEVTLGSPEASDQNAALILANRADVGNPITVSANGTGTATLGADNSGSGQNAASFNGTITLNRPTTLLGSVTDDRLAFNGKITGDVGILTVTGGARTTFASTASDFTGDIHITGPGTILQASAGTAAEVIPNHCNLTVDADAFFQLASSSGPESINALLGEGTVRTYPVAGQPFGSTLIIGSTNGSGTFTGSLTDGAAPLSLTKIGSGTQVLAGTSTHSGPTTILAGTLRIDGTHPASSPVTVASGATLGGTGTILSTVTAAGTLAPGANGSGTLTTGPTTLSGTLACEIDGNSAGTLHTSTLNVTGATLMVNEISPGTAFPYTIITYAPGGLTGKLSAPAGYAIDDSTDGVIRLTKTTGGFSAWASANAPGQSPTMDHDRDGIPNGIEYFMGLSGSSPTANPTPAADRSIRWPIGPAYPGSYGTDFVIETSTNLSAWTTIPASEVTLGTHVIYQIPASTTRTFVRLKVTGP